MSAVGIGIEDYELESDGSGSEADINLTDLVEDYLPPFDGRVSGSSSETEADGSSEAEAESESEELNDEDSSEDEPTVVATTTTTTTTATKKRKSAPKRASTVAKKPKVAPKLPGDSSKCYTLAECQVCCDPLAAVVSCASCGYTGCVVCWKQYLLSTSTTAHCMKCKNAWPPMFLYLYFAKSWIDGEYRKYQKKLSLEREKALLPATMIQFEQLNYFDRRLNEIAQERNRARQVYRDIQETYERLTYARRMENVAAIFTYDTGRTLGAEFDRTTTISFICPCPRVSSGERCRGMINTRHKCAVCEKRVCNKCRMPIDTAKKATTATTTTTTTAATTNDNNESVDPAHVCNPDDVATVDLIKKDTKPCPKCSVPITRSSGCDQMFCTACKTLFSWNTLKIEHGIAHNPYALAYQRLNGGLARDINDVPCGGLIDVIQDYGNYLKWLRDPNFYQTYRSRERLTQFSATTDIVRWDAGIYDVERVHRTVAECNERIAGCRRLEFEQLRKAYLRYNMSEVAWTKQIFTYERRNERNKLIEDVTVTFRNLMVDRFRDLSINVRDVTVEIRAKAAVIVGPMESPTMFNARVGDIRQVVASINKAFLDDFKKIALFVNDAFMGLRLLGVARPVQIRTDLDSVGWTQYTPPAKAPKQVTAKAAPQFPTLVPAGPVVTTVSTNISL